MPLWLCCWYIAQYRCFYNTERLLKAQFNLNKMSITKNDPTEWANISVGSDHIRREIEHIIISKKEKRTNPNMAEIIVTYRAKEINRA